MCSLISYKKIPSGFALKPEGDMIEPAAVCVAGRASAGPWLFYMAPMQLVAPRAVTIAVAILAIICTMNFNVSFFVIAFNV